MSDPLIAPDFERLITLGLSRAPAKTGDETPLTALVLLAQRKRYRRHAITAYPAQSRLHDDPRPIMPDTARKPLTRLASSLPKDGWTLLGETIFDRLDARGLRLHPFDLPRLETLLRACPGRLGVAERAWLGLKSSTTPDAPAADTAALNEADWTLLPKAQKAAVIRHMRTHTPAQARAWVEAHIAKAPADVRAALVEALEPGLSDADTPLLERLAKEDRAASVKEAATELLSATCGSDAYKAKLAKAVTLIETGKTMLGRRTIKVNAAEVANLYDLPANASTGARALAAAEALNRAFRSLTFGDIAAALSMKAEDLAAAITADDPLAAPLSVAALNEGETSLTTKVMPHLAKLGLSELIGRFGATLLKLPPTDRAAILETLTPHILQWRWAHELQWLGRMAGGFVPDALARKMLSGGIWKSSDAPSIDASTYAVFASIMPKGRDADFAAAIADLPRKDTAAAYEFIAFVTALEGPTK